MVFCSKCCNYRVDNDNHNEYFNSLPRLDISSTISNIPHLTNLDADLHMQSDVNFNCYDIHNFHADPEVADCFNENCFSAIHCNIRSLSANYDKLESMLVELYHPFSIIGLTETKIKTNQDNTSVLNIIMPGYHFESQPTLSNAGGVGFYISNNYKYRILSEMTCQSPVRSLSLYGLRCIMILNKIFCVLSIIDIQMLIQIFL